MSSVCDLIGNKIPTSASKWSFEIKLFRENPHSLGVEASTQNRSITSRAPPPNFLHTLTYSTNPKETICLVKDVGTALVGPFDQMLTTKLQSLWQLRQAVRGEGTAFEMNGGEYWIRLGNMMLQGNFRGLLIEVEYTNCDSFWSKEETDSDEKMSGNDDAESGRDLEKSETFQKIKSVLDFLTSGTSPLNGAGGRLITGPARIVNRTEPFTRVETSWQYIEAL